MKHTFKMITVIAMLLSIVPCGAASNPSALVGRWVGVSGDEKGVVMELLSDGTGIATVNSVGVPITWKTEKNRFYSTASGLAEAEDYKQQGSLLTFTKDNGKVNEYTKCNKDCQEAANKYAKAKVEAAVAKTKLAKVKKEFGTFFDSRDGKSYKTVKLDNQTWLAENLNYNASGSKCYDNSESNCRKYGRLYNWETALNACPKGWHLPSDAEWSTLVDLAGGSDKAGNILKVTSGWENNGNGVDAASFSALPGGYGHFGVRFNNVGDGGFWWSATEYDASNAWSRSMYNGDAEVHRQYVILEMDKQRGGKSHLFSVRCVQGYTTNNYAKAIAAVEAKLNKIKKEFGSFTDSRDGKSYKTVKLDNQTWMAENLNYNASGSKCYDNNESNCKKYGRLYNWSTANSTCPSGWHLPSKAEWDTLIAVVYDSSAAAILKVADSLEAQQSQGRGGVPQSRGVLKLIGTVGHSIDGIILKAARGWADNGNGVDAVGFSALPGGHFSDGNFNMVGEYGGWWSATDEECGTTAYSRTMVYKNVYTGMYDYNKDDLFSVRCIKGDYAALKEITSGSTCDTELGGRRGSALATDGCAEGGSISSQLGCLMGGNAGESDLGTKAKASLKAPSARDIDMDGDAARSKAEIMAVVNARMPGLRNIYNKYLKLKPDFSGKVTLKFTIAPSGDIFNIDIVSSTTGYGEFDNAVKNMVATWKWKVIKSGNTTPTIPFNFVE